jgi:hypothetical protein
MTNAIKGIVSKKKKRYKQDGFNLDLSCEYLTVGKGGERGIICWIHLGDSFGGDSKDFLRWFKVEIE